MSTMKNCARIIFGVLGISFLGFRLDATVPAGYYYAADGKHGAELKTALYEIISSMHTLGYGSGEDATWEGFSRTDRKEDGSVWDRYSDEIRYFDGFNAVGGMHIEHSFPKSWWGAYENNAYRDLHHLFPADGSANSAKNNLPLGEVTGVSGFDNGVSKVGKNGWGVDYTDRCFEPADEYKGDFARAYFYVVTAYENLCDYWQSPMLDNNTYPVWKEWALDMLLEWHSQDPPCERELARNDSVYTIQGNRNPYIDYPDLVEYIWGAHREDPFRFPAETLPFLALPRRDQIMDMGVIMLGDNKSEQLDILGNNLTSSLSLSWAIGGIFELSDYEVSAQEVHDGCTVEISCRELRKGEYRDTVIISGGGIETPYRIPVQVVSVPSFIETSASDVTATEALIHWINYPEAIDYQVSLWSGNTSAGDLIISAYVEGSGYNKAIEIYNGTGVPVDLSAYSLRMEVNGSGSFVNDTPLGPSILNNGETYLLLNSLSTDGELIAKASQIIPGGETSPLNFNGNDAVALCRDGIMIDVVGVAGEIAYWGQDKTLYRRSEITHPTSRYNGKEWISSPKDDFSRIGLFRMQLDDKREYIQTDKSIGLVQNYRFTELRPLTRYTYQVSAVIPLGIVKAAYSMQFETDSLAVPQLLDASDITDGAFRINWEEVQGADNYEIICFTQTGEQHVYTEGFDEVDSSGKPLPDNWEGTASGNYTSVASSGVSAPSVALKNTGEYLQTPRYNEGIVKVSFMYRFASSGTGSYIVVEKESDNSWTAIDTLRYVDTSKNYPEYTFSIDEHVTSVKVVYAHKEKGNVAVDDASITYGAYVKDIFSQEKVGNITTHVIEGLSPQTEYGYQVRSVCKDVVSNWSSVQRAVTADISAVTSVRSCDPLVYVSGRQIIIATLCGSERISVYNLSGQMLYAVAAEGKNQIAVNVDRGIYIIKIEARNKIFNKKIIL